MRFLRNVWRDRPGGKFALISLAVNCVFALIGVAETATGRPEFAPATIVEKEFCPRRLCDGIRQADGGPMPVRVSPVDAWKLRCRMSDGRDVSVSVGRGEWDAARDGDAVRLVRRHGHVIGGAGDWELDRSGLRGSAARPAE